MRVSACATIALAFLASDAAAWRSRGWRLSRPQQGSGSGSGSVINPVTCTDAVEVPAATTPAALPPVAAPTTLIQVTTTAAAPAADTQAPVSSSSLSSDEQGALDAHNAARSEVGTPALEWDDALAQAALEWAQHLTSVGTLTHSSGTGQGENLYMESGSRGSGGPLTRGSDAWISEKSAYSGQRIGDGNFASYGHYTQVVWKSTTKVGVASASDSSGRTYVVARYSPAGNFVGQTPF